MKFRTRYTYEQHKPSCMGNHMKDVYELVVEKSGKKVVKKVGETDLQAAIDAEAASVDLRMILAQFEAGDEGALERAKAFYADVSEIPVNLQEIMQLNQEGSKFFYSLPKDIRAIYGNDYMQFVVDPGRVVDALEKKQPEVVKMEVTKDDDTQQ